MALVTVTGGVLIDKLIKSGFVSTTVGRKIAQCSGKYQFKFDFKHYDQIILSKKQNARLPKICKFCSLNLP